MERKIDYSTGRGNGMSFIANGWVFTGAEGYRVKSDADDAHLFMVVRYDAAGETPFYGGRGLPEDDAHKMAARLAGTTPHPKPVTARQMLVCSVCGERRPDADVENEGVSKGAPCDWANCEGVFTDQ
jgi:hypothetical protein